MRSWDLENLTKLGDYLAEYPQEEKQELDATPSAWISASASIVSFCLLKEKLHGIGMMNKPDLFSCWEWVIHSSE